MNSRRLVPSARHLGAALVLLATVAVAAGTPTPLSANRAVDRPIIREDMLAGADGASINGPSLIRVPPWVQNPLGKYYLYFAHHAGKYLRLAYADRLEGPWKIYTAGVQPLTAQKTVAGHIASPDAVIDEKARRIYLFYHGGNPNKKSPKVGDPDGEAGQITSVSVSPDGINFTPLDRVVGPAYLRVFEHNGAWFALNHSGMLRRAAALGEPFHDVARIIGPEIVGAVDPARLGEPGATPADQRPPSGPRRYAMRHVGLDLDGDRLVVYFSCVGHRPERILATMIDLRGPPETWRAQGTIEVLRPGTTDEGANLPLAYSNGGISRTRVNELRDPAVYRDGRDAWLVYSIAGEHGLGLAKLSYENLR
jgi:hypothetical protein